MDDRSDLDKPRTKKRLIVNRGDLTDQMLKERERLEFISKKEIKSIFRKAQAQREEELQLIKNGNMCKEQTLTELRSTINNLDVEALKREIDMRFYNSDVMMAMSCISKTAFYVSEDDAGVYLRIKKWLRDVRRIGSESTAGVAMTADLDESKNMFVIKAALDDFSDDEMVHEIVVGLYGTNLLRYFIPNFAYVYGGFKCSPPEFNDKKLITWCSGENKVHYALYENVANSVSWGDYAKNATIDQFLNMYLQVIYALDKAGKICEFTHYDLHDNNVLIRKLEDKEDFAIKYDTENGEEYIITDRIATIIDYGKSHIKLHGKDYGDHGMLKFIIYPDKFHPFHDAYKLLMFTARTVRDNKDLLKELAKIYKFFDEKGDFERGIKDQDELFYAIPLRFSENNKLLDFAKFIRNTFKCDFISEKPGDKTVLACEGSCPTMRAVLDKVGLNKNTEYEAGSLIEYYDVYRNTGKKLKMNYKALKEVFITGIKQEYKLVREKVNSVELYSVPHSFISMDDEKRKEIMNRNVDLMYEVLAILEEYIVYLTELYMGKQVIDEHESLDFFEFYSLNPSLMKLVDTINDNNMVVMSGTRSGKRKDSAYWAEKFKLSSRLHDEVNSLHSEIYKFFYD